MEKNIRIVWILTVITALLMIGGQGYWLYNQYNYSADEYMQELHKQLEELEEQELQIRYLRSEEEKGPSQRISISYNSLIKSSADSLKLPKITSDTSILFYYTLAEVESINVDSLLQKGKAWLKNDSILICDSFQVQNMPDDLLFNSSLRHTLQYTCPFSVALFDSLTQSKGIRMENVRQTVSDTLIWHGSYHSYRKGLVHVMKIDYPYCPLTKEVLTGEIAVPLPPLLKQMMWQLVGSLLLILLLVYCLVYQIRTILKQWKVDELRKGFVNTMIHELKRPVQTLKMCIAFLNNKPMRTDEQTVDAVVQDAMFELDNLSAYLFKVRELTRADDEHTLLSIRRFDLSETVDKLIRLNNASTDKLIRFESTFTERPLWMTGDPVHIANCLSNLIENAIKYSGAEVCISVEASLHDQLLQIKVADNGIGIPPQEQKRVFEKFYRAQNIPDANLPGIGLGLSYVKLIVEAHQGHIRLLSHPGKGTTFIIEIPQ